LCLRRHHLHNLRSHCTQSASCAPVTCPPLPCRSEGADIVSATHWCCSYLPKAAHPDAAAIHHHHRGWGIIHQDQKRLTNIENKCWVLKPRKRWRLALRLKQTAAGSVAQAQTTNDRTPTAATTAMQRLRTGMANGKRKINAWVSWPVRQASG